ncbi:MAG: hypothetical protein ACHQHN_18820 [Sphingobacteriales bacterium]
MKTRYVLILLSLFMSCNSTNQRRKVSLLMDASSTLDVKSCRLKIMINDKKISDTIIHTDDLHPDLPKLVTQFTIDSTRKNLLTVRVNSKDATIDLNKIHDKNIVIHVFYDDMTKIQNEIRFADSIANSRRRILNINKLADSLRKLIPVDKRDTLILNVEHR